MVLKARLSRWQWFMPLLVISYLIIWGGRMLMLFGTPEQMVLLSMDDKLDWLRIPNALSIAVALLLTFMVQPRALVRSSVGDHCAVSWVQRLVAVSWSLGLANALWGVFPSLLGLIIPFSLGFLLNAIDQWKFLYRPLKHRLGLVLVAVVFIALHTALYLMQPPIDEQMKWFKPFIWMCAIPLISFLYLPDRRSVNLFYGLAVRITMAYLLSVVAAYWSTCYMLGLPWSVAFTFNKAYIVALVNNNGSNLASLLNVNGFQHYTFIGLTMASVVFYQIRKVWAHSAVWGSLVLLGVLSVTYFFILQSRFMLLVSAGVTAVTVMLLLGRRWRRVWWLFVVMFVMGVLLVGSFPEYFVDQDRYAAWQVALRSDGLVTWVGHGFGSAHQLLAEASQPKPLPHLHNQYLESLYEVGVVGLFMMLLWWATYTYYAWRERNYVAIGLIVLHLMLMFVDLNIIFEEYSISMLFMLCLSLSLSSPKVDYKLTKA